MYPSLNVVHLLFAGAMQQLQDNRDLSCGVLDGHQPQEVGVVLLDWVFTVLVCNDKACRTALNFSSQQILPIQHRAHNVLYSGVEISQHNLEVLVRVLGVEKEDVCVLVPTVWM